MQISGQWAVGWGTAEELRVFNEVGSTIVSVKLSPTVHFGQVIIYNGFEQYQRREWSASPIANLAWSDGCTCRDYSHVKYRPPLAAHTSG